MQRGKAQPKLYADSLTLTGKEEKDYLDVMNIATW